MQPTTDTIPSLFAVQPFHVHFRIEAVLLSWMTSFSLTLLYAWNEIHRRTDYGRQGVSFCLENTLFGSFTIDEPMEMEEDRRVNTWKYL